MLCSHHQISPKVYKSPENRTPKSIKRNTTNLIYLIKERGNKNMQEVHKTWKKRKQKMILLSPLRYFCSKQCPFSNYSLTKTRSLLNILPYVCTPKTHGYTKIRIDHAKMFMNLFFQRTSQLQDHPIFFALELINK